MGVRPYLSQLPDETKTRIIDFLPARDVVNLRVTSRAFGGVCTHGLFNNMKGNYLESGVVTIRPHLDDMQRLKEISSRPHLAGAIKHVKIYTGDFYENSLTREADRFLDDTQHLRMLTLHKLVHKVQLNFGIHCNYSDISKIFSLLPNVDSLSIISKECPFLESDDIHEIWNSMWKTAEGIRHFDCQRSRRSRDLYERVLIAASRNFAKTIKHLELDTLHAEFFKHRGQSKDNFGALPHEADARFPYLLEKQLRTELEAFVADTQSLKIGLFRSNRWYPNIEEVFQELVNFLGCMKCLTSLSLSWGLADVMVVSRVDPWGKMFSDIFQMHWPHLEELRLHRLRCHNSLLSIFILRHAANLKRVSINRCALDCDPSNSDSEDEEDEGETIREITVRELLVDIRDKLDLQKFQMLTDAEDRPIFDDSWKSLPEHKLSDVDWKFTTGIPPENVNLLEMFVMGKCEWPMETDRPRYCRWLRRDEWRITVMWQDNQLVVEPALAARRFPSQVNNF